MSVFPTDGGDFDSLVHAADERMYADKQGDPRAVADRQHRRPATADRAPR